MYVLEEFNVNPELSNKLFDMSHLKTLYQPMASTEPSPAPSQLDEVKKTIKDFSKTFE
jgi:hypothetical protein